MRGPTSKPRALSHAGVGLARALGKASGAGPAVAVSCTAMRRRPKALQVSRGTRVAIARMRLLLILLVLGAAAPAPALLRLDDFAGRGFGDGGPAIAAAVLLPADGVSDAAGNVYFSDRGDELVRKVDAGGTITTVAGNGSIGT